MRRCEHHGIAPIDLLVVNLYPFEQVTAAPDCTLADAIENIDIGGPAMLRAAAKNHEHVAVAVDPADYAEVLEALAHGGTSLALRRRLAAKTFAHTARYDGLVANWLGTRADADKPEAFAPSLRLAFERRQPLRYGENPHQGAALYAEQDPPPGTVAAARALARARNCPTTTSPTPTPRSSA
jgi:phosphoribosylaminoimidazolecarboxamide formyltransferase/IMP cyclohydrolase